MLSGDLHYVDLIGFNATERSMLTSIFALSARRSPGFVQFDPITHPVPHLYVVDAGDGAAMEAFSQRHRALPLPAILIGATDPLPGCVLFERPMQWARLIQAMENALATAQSGATGATGGVGAGNGLNFGHSRPGSPHPERESAESAFGDTVLVVDDNATVRMFMKAKLAPFNFEVDYAETGEQAVGLTGERDYACVFLDVVLPGIDGYQVCKLIKSNKQAIRKTAVVMLTSRSSPFDKLRGSLAGCDEYLTKPLDEDRLLAVVAKFLPSGRKRAKRAMQNR